MWLKYIGHTSGCFVKNIEYKVATQDNEFYFVEYGNWVDGDSDYHEVEINNKYFIIVDDNKKVLKKRNLPQWF